MLSVSSLKLFHECPRRYYHVYERGLVPKRESPDLLLGSWVHKWLEQYYKGGDLFVDSIIQPALEAVYASGDAETLERNAAILRGVAANYPTWAEATDRWHVLEVEHNLEYAGVRGRCDLLARVLDGPNEGLWVVDHKTCSFQSGAHYAQRASYDPQALIYAAATGARGIVYNLIYKPSIRRRQAENPSEFVARMTTEYADASRYFQRHWCYLNGTLGERVSAMVQGSRSLLEAARSLKYWPQNTAACFSHGQCPFVPLCSGNVGEEFYDKDPKRLAESTNPTV